MSDAVTEYKIFLSKSTIAVKSQKMAHTTLFDLVKNLGADFAMTDLNDDIVEDEWLVPRCALVVAATAKRDLSVKQRAILSRLGVETASNSFHWTSPDLVDKR